MRPTTATVNLDAIADNYRLASESAPGSASIAVIKSNAYGHGMLEVAHKLEALVPAFAVAMIDEAVQLRDAGINKPILILQGVNHAADYAEAAARGFWVMLHQREQVQALLSSKRISPLKIWLKLDTGMHRFGLTTDELDEVFPDLISSDNVQSAPVLCTHLACADELRGTLTQQQVSMARKYANKYQLKLSIANSAGILFWPQSHADWNRPGYMLYGQSPSGSFDSEALGLRPAMSMNSEIVAIRHIPSGEGVGYGLDWIAARDSKIGTIPIGYGDGYPRHAPSGTPVLVNGQRVPLTGRVSMDAISVDLTDLDTAETGDPVELWGDHLSVNEIASVAGTIGYEILAGLSGRVPLIFQSNTT
jgi:alanine racemase